MINELAIAIGNASLVEQRQRQAAHHLGIGFDHTALHNQSGCCLANHLVGNHGTTQTLRVVVEQPDKVTHTFFMIGGHLACLCLDHKRALLLVQKVDEMLHRFVFA